MESRMRNKNSERQLATDASRSRRPERFENRSAAITIRSSSTVSADHDKVEEPDKDFEWRFRKLLAYGNDASARGGSQP